jgi:WD40 repeat protein
LAYYYPGKTLALITENSSSHTLRLFDVARSNKDAVETLFLEPFPQADDFREVVMATFSPDGTWLAVGRNDNQTHVYDTRFLGRNRGPIRRFTHQPMQHRGGKSHGYGVVFTEWVPSIFGKDLGLVTSGGDGMASPFFHRIDFLILFARYRLC